MPVSFDVQVNVQDFAALGTRWQHSGSRHLENAMERAVAILHAAIVKNAPAHTGTLRNSFQERVEGHWPDITGRVQSTLIYASVMEFGRRPGRMPPPAALERWGFLKFRQAGLGFILARAIARRGIEPRYYARKAFEENKDRIERIFHSEVEVAIKALR